MPDPRLVSRAQRAATMLERAWDRWRSAQGLSAEPMPPVSSYVGYSTEEPWGRPRVVFGIDAEDAERLAALLQGSPAYSPEPGSPDYSRFVPEALDEVRGRIPVQAGPSDPIEPGSRVSNGAPDPLNATPPQQAPGVPLGDQNPPRGEGAEQPAAGSSEQHAADQREPSGTGRGEAQPERGESAENRIPLTGASRSETAGESHGSTVGGSTARASMAGGSMADGPQERPRGYEHGAPGPDLPRDYAADPFRYGPPVPAPGNHGPSETMAAELAGWAAGELPGEAAARLAAWAAVGGPAARSPREAQRGTSGAAVKRVM
ncbi:MAG TPA: hypothetical protein VG253_14830 [Streptosporangiaceae bacterium]|nr:hypothetical protein [Streptosporangiaceae bacterium]